MKKYQGDVSLKGNFDVLSDKPLDTRLVVQTKEDLYNLNSSYAYEGMPVSCVNESTIYILIDKSKISLSEGWQKVSSGRPTFVMSQSNYQNLSIKDENAIYFIYEDNTEWSFGDDFPIILT